MHFCCVLPVRSWEGEHCPLNPSDVPCFQKETAFWSLISRCPTGPCTSIQFYFFSLSLSLPCLDFTFCPSAAACGGRTEAGGALCRSRDSLGASPGIAGAFITPDYFFPALFFNTVVPWHNSKRIKHPFCSKCWKSSCPDGLQ